MEENKMGMKKFKILMSAILDEMEKKGRPLDEDEVNEVADRLFE